VVVGDGKRCFFWIDKWIQGRTIEEIAPDIYKIINPLIKARKTVAEALVNGMWIDDIRKPVNIRGFLQVVYLWEELKDFQLNQGIEDVWTWTWNTNGTFSSKSAYMAHFLTATKFPTTEETWRAWAPLRCKIATWLIIKERVWTANRLAKRDLPHNEKCVFCNNSEEDARHLFMGCAVTNII
jgi:hypothetical protein